jgi:hypothetical protein
MRMRMVRFLFKQTYRASITQMKNYFGVIVALFIAVAIGGYSAITQIRNSSFSLQTWNFELAIVCSMVCIAIIVFGKRPPFLIHPATIHFFAHASVFRRQKTVVLIKKIIGQFAAICLVGLVIYNFSLSVHFACFVFSFSSYFLTVSLIKWFKYNGEKIIFWFTRFFACTALFLLFTYYSNFYLLGMQLIMAGIFIIHYFRTHIDMSRYYDDSLYIERMNSASRHKDMAVMQQITADHIANKKRTFKLNNLPIKKSNVLFYKALIETLRMSKQVIVVLLLFLVFAIVINRTPVLATISIFGDPNISKLIGMLSLACFVTNLREVYYKQALSILSKKQEGLFLPYTNTMVILNYLLICNVAIVLSIMIVGLILRTNILSIVISELIFLFGVSIAFWNTRKKQWLMIASNVIIFAATYCIF